MSKSIDEIMDEFDKNMELRKLEELADFALNRSTYTKPVDNSLTSKNLSEALKSFEKAIAKSFNIPTSTIGATYKPNICQWCKKPGKLLWYMREQDKEVWHEECAKKFSETWFFVNIKKMYGKNKGKV